jgi:hypothetical protein
MSATCKFFQKKQIFGLESDTHGTGHLWVSVYDFSPIHRCLNRCVFGTIFKPLRLRYKNSNLVLSRCFSVQNFKLLFLGTDN